MRTQDSYGRGGVQACEWCITWTQVAISPGTDVSCAFGHQSISGKTTTSMVVKFDEARLSCSGRSLARPMYSHGQFT